MDNVPQPSVPEPSRRRAVTHVQPISIADIVRDVAGSDPMRVVRDFDRIYMPDGMCIVNSAVDGQSGEHPSRRSELKRKAENITSTAAQHYHKCNASRLSQM